MVESLVDRGAFARAAGVTAAAAAPPASEAATARLAAAATMLGLPAAFAAATDLLALGTAFTAVAAPALVFADRPGVVRAAPAATLAARLMRFATVTSRPRGTFAPRFAPGGLAVRFAVRTGS